MGTGKPLKYEPLRRYLLAQSGETVTLTLAEIEAIIGTPLPASARRRPWWTNLRDHQPMHMLAWWSAGWRASTVGLWSIPPSVTFVRR